MPIFHRSRFPVVLSFLIFAFCLPNILPAQTTGPAAEETAAIDQRLTGKVPNAFTYNLFGLGDFDGGKLVAWNKSLWGAEWLPYFTCFSPWNSLEALYQGGTLLTPKHVLLAEHFSGATGSNTLHAGVVLKFLGKNDVFYARKLVGVPKRVGSSDLCLGTLDNDLPPDVIPAQVLPAGLPADFLPPGTPVLFANKNKELRVAEVVSFGARIITAARGPVRAPWTLPGPAAGGDSGCPVFILLHNRPVLWWLFHFPNSGESISSEISVLNGMLGSGYKLNVASLQDL